MPIGLGAGWAESVTATMARQAQDLGGAARAAKGDDAAQAQAGKLTELEPLVADRDDAALDGDKPAGTVAPGENGSRELVVSSANRTGGDLEEKTERSPGMGAMWQAPDNAWRPLTLGLEEWPPRRLWPYDPSESEPGTDGGEDHDPLPPRQRPDEGDL
jgi:hypothetical protein